VYDRTGPSAEYPNGYSASEERYKAEMAAQQNGGYAPNYGGGYAPNTGGGYAPNNSGYAPNNGGYGPSNGGYGPSNGGYAPNGYAPNNNGGYGMNGPNGCNYPGPGGARLDLSTAQPRQSASFRFLVPQGWQAADQNGVTLVCAPDMSMAVGVMTPAPVSGQLSAEQFMKNVLTNVGQFQNIQVGQSQRTPAQPPYTDAGTFMITYSVMGQQFMGMVSCAVMQQGSQTSGFVQVILGTQQAMQMNGMELMRLAQSFQPLNQGNMPTPGPTPQPQPQPQPNYPTPGPTPNYPTPNPVADNPMPAPAPAPVTNIPAPAPTPTPAPAANTGGSDWNWGGR
jgi:hypothetical protein